MVHLWQPEPPMNFASPLCKPEHPGWVPYSLPFPGMLRRSFASTSAATHMDGAPSAGCTLCKLPTLAPCIKFPLWCHQSSEKWEEAVHPDVPGSRLSCDPVYWPSDPVCGTPNLTIVSHPEHSCFHTCAHAAGRSSRWRHALRVPESMWPSTCCSPSSSASASPPCSAPCATASSSSSQVYPFLSSCLTLYAVRSSAQARLGCRQGRNAACRSVLSRACRCPLTWQRCSHCRKNVLTDATV